MVIITLASPTDFDGFRDGARQCLIDDALPTNVSFQIEGHPQQTGLFDVSTAPQAAKLSVNITRTVQVSRTYIDLARDVVLHRSEHRFDLLYRLLWRSQREANLMKIVTDPDVAQARELAKNISRAAHKMKAFVRFRRVENERGQTERLEQWVAWFEPAHRVLERTAPFFANRFTTMDWTILTPDGCCHWDGKSLSFGPPGRREDAPSGDPVEDLWTTYYASTFNPARLKTRTMQSEMPKAYWRNLPEAALIPGLIASARSRTESMVNSDPPVPSTKGLKSLAPDVVLEPEQGQYKTFASLNDGLAACRKCPLWRDTTQVVCGQGLSSAHIMIVGEQPGDQEDLSGLPFVGPAGKVLDQALKEAGLPRNDLYLTNAVKHFKYSLQGKRRLHRTPDTEEIGACRNWLMHEKTIVQPKLIVALGATAAQSVLGCKVAVNSVRGQIQTFDDGASVLVTYHPAYVLRLPDREQQCIANATLIADLALAARYVDQKSTLGDEPIAVGIV